MTPKLIFFLAAICPLCLAAQPNYKEGYIITNAGDTINGFVNYREWYSNPDRVQFRNGTAGAVIEITPSDAKEVSITGVGTYQRFEVTITMNEVRFEKLSDENNSGSITKTVFLKQLLKGNFLNLYSYTDKIKTRFYVLDQKNDIPQELLLTKTLEEMREQTQAIYRQQLLQYARTYGTYSSKLETKMESVDYAESSLVKIIGQINTNSQMTVTAASNKPKGTSYFAGVGIMQARITYDGANLITADRLDANGDPRYKKITTTNISPRLAMGINFFSKLWVHRLSIKTEVSAYRFTSTIVSYTKYNNLTPAENQYTFHFDGWSIALSPQLVYKIYSSADFKAYAGAGLGLNFLAVGKNSSYKLGLDQPLTFNETTDDYLPVKNLNFAFTGRVGVLIIQKFDLYIYGSTPVQYNLYDPGDFSVKSGVLALCAAYNF